MSADASPRGSILGETILDVRDLPPPEPLELAVAAIRALKPGCWVRLIHRREPCMLFPQLLAAGYTHKTCEQRAPGGETVFVVFIWKVGDDHAEARIKDEVAGMQNKASGNVGSSC